MVLSVFTDFDYSGLDGRDPTVVGAFTPADRHTGDLAELLSEVMSWSRALATVRDSAAVA